MENASKALIIAGSILLAILLISLGIVIYTQSQKTIDSMNMNEQEIQAFNNKFIQYEGNNKRGAEVNALVQLIRVNNQSAASEESKGKIVILTVSGISDPNSSKLIKITTDPNTGVMSTQDNHTNIFPSGSIFKVEFSYKNGLIHEVQVKK